MQTKSSIELISVQVYKIENWKRKIVRHIRKGRNAQEIKNLLALANAFIKKESKQLVYLDVEMPFDNAFDV